jgi:hypothetical protein
MLRTGPRCACRTSRVVLLAVAALGLGACGKAREEAQRASGPATAGNAAESTAVRPARPESTIAKSIAGPETPAARYGFMAVHDPRRLAALIDTLGPVDWFEVLKLNRVDLAHVRDRDSLVMPAAFGDSLSLSPFPRDLPAVRDTAKLLLVSIRVQAFAAYDSGRLVRWGPTSTGRKDKPTPVGLYHVTWKDRERTSSFDEEWLLKWCVNIENRQGVSLHQYEMPGRPASHACVRLLEPDATWMYPWVEQWRVGPDRRTIERPGTPVVVFGAWALDRRAPWKLLPTDPLAVTLSTDEITGALRILAEGTVPRFEPPEGPALAGADTARVASRGGPTDTSGARRAGRHDAPAPATDSARR